MFINILGLFYLTLMNLLQTNKMRKLYCLLNNDKAIKLIFSFLHFIYIKNGVKALIFNFAMLLHMV